MPLSGNAAAGYVLDGQEPFPDAQVRARYVDRYAAHAVATFSIGLRSVRRQWEPGRRRPTGRISGRDRLALSYGPQQSTSPVLAHNYDVMSLLEVCSRLWSGTGVGSAERTSRVEQMPLESDGSGDSLELLKVSGSDSNLRRDQLGDQLGGGGSTTVKEVADASDQSGPCPSPPRDLAATCSKIRREDGTCMRAEM